MFLVPATDPAPQVSGGQQSLAYESRDSVTSGGKWARKRVVLMEERERRREERKMIDALSCLSTPCTSRLAKISFCSQRIF